MRHSVEGTNALCISLTVLVTGKYYSYIIGTNICVGTF